MVHDASSLWRLRRTFKKFNVGSQMSLSSEKKMFNFKLGKYSIFALCVCFFYFFSANFEVIQYRFLRCLNNDEKRFDKVYRGRMS